MSGKLSFSERDKQRQDRARGETPTRGKTGHARDRYRDAKLRGDALSAADALFGGEAAKDLEQAVLTAAGRAERTAAAKELVARQGMPGAPHVLTQMLKVSDEALVLQVVAALDESLADASAAVREVAVRTAGTRATLVRNKELRLALKAFKQTHSA